MSANEQQEQALNPISYIARAPGLVFLLVAAADGTVDKKEIKQFSKLLKKPEFEILVAAMQKDGSSLMDLFTDIQNSQLQPLEELRQLRVILDSYFPEDAAMAYKVTLMRLAKGIAEASGGLFGVFGSKISKEEEVALGLVAAELGLLESNNQQTNQSDSAKVQPAQTQYATAADLPDHLFPVLKPADWAESAKSDVVMRGLYADSEIRANEPVVGYALDLPEAIEFLSKSSVGDSISIDDVHNKALQNLNRRLLADTEWHELSHEVSEMQGGAVSGLVLSGDYFSSEALLSKELLELAHQKLDAAMMMVVAPERGKLFATKIISEGKQAEPELLLFASVAVANYFKPEQAPISPNVWIVRNSRLVGQIEGMDGIISGAKQYAEEQAQKEEEKLTHSAKIFQDKNGIGIKVEVVAHDIDVMLKNLQHLIRAYAQQATQHQQFKGVINVNVDVQDPQYQLEHQSFLDEQLAEMSQFLINQFATLGIACADNSEIQLSCNVKG